MSMVNRIKQLLNRHQKEELEKVYIPWVGFVYRPKKKEKKNVEKDYSQDQRPERAPKG